MLDKLCRKISNRFVAMGIIPEEDEALYLYGLQQGLTSLFYIILTILLGIFFGIVWHNILFLLFFMPIRIYGGGFHARTPKNCFFLSCAMILAISLILKYISLPAYLFAAIIAMTGILIFMLAPVSDANKPFTAKERQHFKKKTRFFLFLELAIGAIALAAALPLLYTGIAVSLGTLSVMLILGILKNRSLEKASPSTNSSEAPSSLYHE